MLFISLKRTYTTDAWHWLFGSILGVGLEELWIILSVTTISVTLVLILWSRLAYATFDPELAQADGVRVGRLEYALLTLSAVTIVASVKVVGVILMAAYLVIPAAAARLLSRSLAAMTGLSVLIGLLSTVSGLITSYFLDVPSGSTIVLSQVGCFVVAAVVSRR